MLASAGSARTLDSPRFLAIKPPLKWKSKRNRAVNEEGTMGTFLSLLMKRLDPVASESWFNKRGTFARTFESDNGGGLTKFH